MARLVAANKEPGEWLAHGRTFDEQRFSPLTQINKGNVSALKLAWFQDLDTHRGQEATPLVIDGVMYVSTAWSKVKAFNALTGEPIWAYDPEVPPEVAVKACCDVVNRGVAAWNGKIYLGTLDGRLIALDAKTGAVVWSKITVDQSKAYTITGAPRIVKGKVIIGNGGAEYGVRGYVAAYDAETGDEAWKFYTVPGNPAEGFENETMARAAKTWTGEWWKLGGGGTVWDSMAYDPDTNLLYVGVGNGSPWNQAYRSPKGGDNLYLASIVALNPDTGAYIWHYQTTPGETWDYTATQHIMVADLEIGGAMRKVVMQAPKNGFFYVLDAKTGALISAKPYAAISWATDVDMKTGRPIENPQARYYKSGRADPVLPGPGGAHSWHPMSFNPKTGLVYIPVNIGGFPYAHDPKFKAEPMGFNTGVNFAAAAMPAIPEVRKAVLASVGGQLLAWDPVAQKARWKVDYPGAGNGGTLSTAGGLVFQGSKGGQFAAFDAETGEKLWSADAQTGAIAAPISFAIDGKQFIAILVGWGGAEALAPGLVGEKGAGRQNISRMLVFSLDGDKTLPPEPPRVVRVLDPPAPIGDARLVALGAKNYAQYCTVCHGDAVHSSGLLPDLRYAAALSDQATFDQIVLKGALTQNGMVSFAAVLDEKGAKALRAYIIKRANEDKALIGASP
jgi:alcohol dehydrogenase (cytochrome c)/quinohemoprotein ethanol dehydrogenase